MPHPVKEEEKSLSSGSAFARSSLSSDSTAVASSNEDIKDEAPAPKQGPGRPSRQIAAIPQALPDWDKKIVRTAQVSMEVKNYQTYNDLLRRTIKQLGGFIASEEQSQSGYKKENALVIKVPVDQFDNALSQLGGGSEGDKLLEKKINAEDVTMEVVDTKARLEAKRAVRQRYLDLLKQAKDMDDILKVQSEINSIQEEIESATGRVAYLTHSAALSTINLNFYQVLEGGAQEYREPSFFQQLRNAFGDGWQLSSRLAIGLTRLWPLWTMALLGWIGWRRWRVYRPQPVKH